MPKWRMVLGALIILASLAAAGATLSAAPLPQEDVYVITYPTSGATVSGLVEITGSVNHPQFTSYGVFYAPGPAATENSQWVRIAFEETPVSNGVLATWDTTATDENGQPVVPNGVYTLALARYRQGGSGPDVPLFFVESIAVNNEEATPTPTPPPEAAPTAVGVTPTPIPIEQPPTPTAAPTPTPAPGSEGTTESPVNGDNGGIGAALNPSRLRDAFVTGVKITLLFFGLWGIYVLVRAIVRYLLRTRRISLPFDLPWRR